MSALDLPRTLALPLLLMLRPLGTCQSHNQPAQKNRLRPQIRRAPWPRDLGPLGPAGSWVPWPRCLGAWAPWPRGPARGLGPLAQGPGPLGPGTWAPWPRGPGSLAQGPRPLLAQGPGPLARGPRPLGPGARPLLLFGVSRWSHVKLYPPRHFVGCLYVPFRKSF